MGKFTITPTMIEQAKDYLPIAQKMAFVDKAAKRCFDILEVRAGSRITPPMQQENSSIKARFLMTVLIRDYLGVPCITVDGVEDLMTEEDYDKFAGSHVLNQIERLKTDANIRNKCFDILQDFRDLEKRLNGQVYNLAQIVNDPASRLLAAMEMDVTPESAAALLEELEKVKKELTEHRKGEENDG